MASPMVERVDADVIEWEKRGAEACAQGISAFHCPLYAPDQMPKVTGESFMQWNIKQEAWHRGFKLERMMTMID